ncbi:g2769 [Coccomyxa viridis]|uniref:G2769 protein n=1 Tax=Coccomyxa viridis TaxID=1274662 RepID=A0ABP1FL75_9CHLO
MALTASCVAFIGRASEFVTRNRPASEVERRVGPGAIVLAVAMWSDKTHEGHHLGPGLHPLVAYTPQAGCQGMRALDAQSYIALLPQVLPKRLGLPPTRKKRSAAQNEWLAKMKRELLDKSLKVILGRWKDIAKTGFMLDSACGPARRVYPLPVVCPTDILEKGDMTFIDVMRCNIRTLAPVANASDPRAAPAPLRTEAYMSEGGDFCQHGLAHLLIDKEIAVALVGGVQGKP